MPRLVRGHQPPRAAAARFAQARITIITYYKSLNDTSRKINNCNTRLYSIYSIFIGLSFFPPPKEDDAKAFDLSPAVQAGRQALFSP